MAPRRAPGIALLLTLALAGAAIPAATLASGDEPGAGETAVTLEGLFRDLSRLEGLSARFEEKKRIALLRVPLESRGAVYFMRPMRLARHVEAPLRAAMFLDAGRLTLTDSHGARTLDLGASAVVSALAGSFVHVLRGDRPALEKNFHMAFTAAGKGWTLALRPRSAELARVLSELSFSGDGLEVHSMKLRETTGDETVTTFSAVNTKRVFSEKEKDALFRPPAK